jgi:hypothetical protein
MISDTTDLVRSEAGQRREWPKASADRLLSFAAAPAFAIMALLTCVRGSSSDMFCGAMQDASPLSGMVPMYLLMCAVHAAPWLKLISRRRSNRGAIPPLQ